MGHGSASKRNTHKVREIPQVSIRYSSISAKQLTAQKQASVISSSNAHEGQPGIPGIGSLCVESEEMGEYRMVAYNANLMAVLHPVASSAKDFTALYCLAAGSWLRPWRAIVCRSGPGVGCSGKLVAAEAESLMLVLLVVG